MFTVAEGLPAPVIKPLAPRTISTLSKIEVSRVPWIEPLSCGIPMPLTWKLVISKPRALK